jgi:hypothetical protein
MRGFFSGDWIGFPVAVEENRHAQGFFTRKSRLPRRELR